LNVSLGFLSFVVACLAFCGLAGLLLLKRSSKLTARLFLFAVICEGLWAGAIAVALGVSAVPPGVLSGIEALRGVAWIVFLINVVQQSDSYRNQAMLRRATEVALLAVAGVGAASVAADMLGLGLSASFTFKVLLSVLALVCIEQVYRNTASDRRWGVKFLCLGLLGLFGFDLVMYTEALLFSRMNIGWWTARGFANAAVMPLLAIAATRNRDWKMELAVSRSVVFHTSTLFLSGAFLMLMATGGYYVRYFGGQWGAVAQVLLLFAAVLVILVIIGSAQLRARWKVFVAKHFFSYRAEWLKLTELLSDTNPEGLGNRAIAGLAQFIDGKRGALWQDQGGGHFVCTHHEQYQGATPELDGQSAFIEFLRAKQWVISMPEWRANPMLYESLEIPDAIGQNPGAWLVVPLMLGNKLIGLVVLQKPLVETDLNWEMRDVIKTAARQISGYLGMQHAVQQLVQAQQFESFNRMSAFVVHDLKNLVAQLTLLLKNAQKFRHNPEFQDDMLLTVENVMDRMQGLLMQLRVGTTPVEAASPVPLGQTIEAAVRSKKALLVEPSVELAQEVDGVAVLAHRDRIERVIGHLVQNAAEATGAQGRIWIRANKEPDSVVIEIEDNGKGMSEEFLRNQLFKPFSSTKSHGMGIGTFESREYIREIGGSLMVESREGQGTKFSIRLPLARQMALT
jgi:putative PEP-CTERM system histidine kinase